jgi:glycerophosphoryl diester phosphodiesterase
VNRFPLGFAHRGARAHAPENTLEAFRLALEMGANALESDVFLTRDGVAVLDHDGVFGGRPVAQLARAQLPAHVPDLSELFEACGPDVPLSLDLKDEAAAPVVIETAREHGALGSLWLCHWNWKVVARWRTLSDEVRLVDSTRAAHMRTPPGLRAARMAELGIDAINLHCCDWRPEWIPVFQAEGRRVFAWDAQDEATLRRLLDWGVDAVYSDHVDLLSAALRPRAAPTREPAPPTRS